MRAAELTAGLRAVLGAAAVRVEHVGSTAAPGTAAEPVYDVQIGDADLDAAERDFDAPLAALGFRRSPHRHDHVPAGPDCNLHVRLRRGTPEGSRGRWPRLPRVGVGGRVRTGC
ncbi:hypothetical protein Kpho02_00490 [Kitasatospora phosalacinea]|uniref:GrpB family protein n=1 Tax=Kitasatospora phosalacinea TaxID=2065 RepID=A0A9W6Q0K3_9ACTN|nr:hypothetical protein Kpho02_00490 [Kitasatospora phosalacinea]